GVRLEVDAAKVGLTPGTVVTGWALTQHDGIAYWDKAGLVTQTPQQTSTFDTLTAWLQSQRSLGGAGLPKEIQDLVKLDPAKRNPAQHKQLRDYFIAHVYSKTRTQFAPLLKDMATLEQERQKIEKDTPATLVFKERAQPRPAYILKRGEYDQRGEQVSRDTPAFLPPLPADAPRNRLGFARWVASPGNPLTARVAVNRFWQQVFGTGIVKTAEDFGSQGEPPSHPELLDWLAVEFMTPMQGPFSNAGEIGWDIKRFMKLLVTSATYRQSSRVTKDRLARDPGNRLLSRGPRFRLDAEMLRDQAL